jgi:hypothetical protein
MSGTVPGKFFGKFFGEFFIEHRFLSTVSPQASLLSLILSAAKLPRCAPA